jgi:HEAT repeat protein
MAQTPNRLESLRTLRYANLDGAFATAFATLVGGTFLVGFVKANGGSDIWIGLLTAIPSLLGILQIPGSILGRRFEGFKSYVLPGGALWRIFYLPFVALPLLAIAPDAKLLILAICVTLASFSQLLVNPIYNDWLAELVPQTSRGWFFSRRNALLAGVGTGVGVIGGLILDYMRKEDDPMNGFAMVFGLGLFCALLSQIFFNRMRDVPRTNVMREGLAEALGAFKRPMADRKFRTVLIFFVAFIFGQTFPGNLFGAYALESLHLPFTVIQCCGAAQAVGSILAGKWWGYFADKYGNRPLLLIAGLGISLTPIAWMLTKPDQLAYNTTVLIIGHIYSGIVWGGVAVCQFNLLLATAKVEDRANYLGVGMATQALIGGIAPLVGAQVLSVARGFMPAIEGYFLIFWMTLIIRLLSVGFLVPVQEEGSAGFAETWRKLRRMNPKGVAALQKLSRSTDSDARQTAIQAVAENRFSLATEEIIHALHDPSPQVRREAAKALARLGERSAVQALVHQLEDHPDLIEEETIEAIGDIGGRDAVPALIKQLQSPRSSLRRAAARALGRIGDRAAVDALVECTKEYGDPDLRRASLQALRALGAYEAHEVIEEALLDNYPSVRIAAAEAVAELKLESAASTLRRSITEYTDEAESELAYALGCVGTIDDIKPILMVASKCTSVTTRRRALLGVARLLNVEREVYSLFNADGLMRDNALMEMLRPAMKRHPRIRLALQKYSGGAEQEALGILAQAKLGETFKLFTTHHSQDSFLVAAAYAKRAV